MLESVEVLQHMEASSTAPLGYEAREIGAALQFGSAFGVGRKKGLNPGPLNQERNAHLRGWNAPLATETRPRRLSIQRDSETRQETGRSSVVR
jgi:hypothetical protein